MAFMGAPAALPNPNNDAIVVNPPDDAVSSLSFSPAGNLLVAGSWNKQVRCWEITPQGQSVAKAQTTHTAPVLCTDFSDDGLRVFSGSCDKTVKMWDLATQQSSQVAQHDAPVKECHWVPEHKLLATGSWDKTLKYWDLRSPNPALSVTLPDRVYAMDVTAPLCVVATANRRILIFDLKAPQQPFRNIESPLKMQTRCIANFADKSGFAVGSIEGRVAIQQVEEKTKKNFAFKCHRHNEQVYAINSISFHPFGTFATCGSDGVYIFWDKDSKQRLKIFKGTDEPGKAQPITCSTFNRDGSIFAYALSYDWSKGINHYDRSKPNQIMLHAVKRDEIEPKKK